MTGKTGARVNGGAPWVPPEVHWATALFVALTAGAVLFAVIGLGGAHFSHASKFGHFLVYYYRSHGYRIPLNVIWGVEGLARAPYWTVFLCLLAVVPAWIGVPRGIPTPRSPGSAPRKKNGSASGFLRSPQTLYLIAMSVALLLAWGLHVPYSMNRLFGDGPTLPGEMEQGIVFAAEVLTCHLFVAVSRLMQALSAALPAAYAGVAVVSVACGVLFSAAACLLALALLRHPLDRFLAVLALALAGYQLQFYGYVETTCVELAAIATFLACGARTLTVARRPHLWMVATIVWFSVALLSHAAGVLLAPALVYCFRASRGRLARGLQWSYGALAGLSGLFLVAIPYYLLVVEPFYLRGVWGNIRGGGDYIMFVPLHMDANGLASGFVYYLMFSPLHLLDILSSLFTACPSALTAIVVSVLLARRAPGRSPEAPAQGLALRFLAVAAACCLLVPLVWNHDFGMSGDWNLASCFLAPLNIFSWCALFLLSHRFADRKDFRLRVCIPLLVVQLLGCSSLFLYLH